ncbi:MAG: T9SS type A sorting domain-containing protein [Tannerellaceae bacterium]|jgi:hypothetical protein|nr:T9SS type A sorting domain-containing protein [Tannerellaceae bacterium]
MKKTTHKTRIILLGALLSTLSPCMSGQVLRNAPGYVHSGSITACFTYMGAVTFSADYRFKSIIPSDGKDTSERLYGFSIPLVGDLNGDGYPEIIGVAKSTTDDAIVAPTGCYTGIHIYNGQTGKRISKLFFSGCDDTHYYNHSGWHGAPSIMALVDSDSDGTIELIVAFPDGSNTVGTNANRYKHKLASFNLRYNSTAGNYSLEERWISTAAYGTGDYEKITPQVVDFDGDGIPEILTYHQIYNAQTGAVLYTFDSTDFLNYLGRNVNAPRGGPPSKQDRWLAFPYVYDMDLDGIYDIVVGGRIYRMKKTGTTFSADIITCLNIGDGYTGVADINGDGIADVVVVSRAGTSNTDDVVIKVWNPGFNSNGVANPYSITSRTITLVSGGANTTGSNSYVYIGDIDGREQEHGGKTYRLPEIAILTRRVAVNNFPRHPNISGIAEVDGGIPASYTWPSTTMGCIFALTYDAVEGNLKGSFIMEHKDRSINTGFTMFDFDNDGIQEICYRDETDLRVIKPVIPFVRTTTTSSNIIMFSKPAKSYTGFEYPVIADIDNDASAEIVVLAHEDSNTTAPWGYIFAVGPTGDKFAPALPVWNQFMYDPFKIKPDLTTPTKTEGRHALNRLSPEFTFRREIKNENNQVIEVIDSLRPFNGTILQVPYFTADTPALFPAEHLKFEPIVYKTAAYILDAKETNTAKRPKIVTVGTQNFAEISVGNWSVAKSVVAAATPIAVYRNNAVSQATFVNKYPLNTLQHETSPGSGTFAVPSSFTGLRPGGEVRIRIPIPNSTDVYWVRLADDSGGSPSWVWRFGLDDDPLGTESNPDLGIGVARRQYRDCDWSDQSARVSKYRSFDDAATVQEYNSIRIDILDNDYFPDYSPYDFYNGLAVTNANISQPPVAGYLTFSGTGHNAGVTYHHDAREVLTTGIDSFEYIFTFMNPEFAPAENTTVRSKVYIYVLESTTGSFAACYGALTTITLAHKPAGSPGIVFNWFDDHGKPLGSGLSRSITMGSVDSVYTIHPIVKTGPYTSVNFPNGELTVHVANTVGSTAVMRWTGLVDNNWNNPGNWVEVKGSYETPVSWSPTTCVDVVIPSGAANYPELTGPAYIRNIAMRDRAMLKNPHVLTYEKASVELKLTPREKDNFISWSAPLKDMYSGDYHFRKSDGAPSWGDAYMMFFQMPNPDITDNTPVANRLTATVGNPGVPLPLGKAFNFRLMATSVNRDSVLTFPKAAVSYTSAGGESYNNLSRTDSHRFITDGVTLSSNQFTLPVAANIGTGAGFMQVTNPYMAYLDIASFLAANSATLETNGYIEWDGSINNNLVGFMQSPEPGMRYISTLPSSGANNGMIAPLKSFFVIKKAGGGSVRMSPAWTTTKGANPYTLRAAGESNILRIKASQGGKTSYAVLHYNPKAHPYYDSGEDVYQLFFDDIPLAVYALTPWKDPLTIYADGDFSTRNTCLGLRVRDAGEVTLEFSGMETFGHNVWLVDKTAGKEIDLRRNTAYTFTVAKTAGGVIGIDDRFAIRAYYTGEGITANEAVTIPRWSISSADRAIAVRSTSLPIYRLQVYDVTGALVYSSTTPSSHFHIPLSQGIYIVKAQVGEEQITEKAFVK